MPRPKKDGAPEPKTRSRKGCWPCKSRKVKCDEAHPSCMNCQKQGEVCDYSIRLNWGGRGKKSSDGPEGMGHIDFSNTSFSSVTESPTLKAERDTSIANLGPQYTASSTTNLLDSSETNSVISRAGEYDSSRAITQHSYTNYDSPARSPQSITQPFERYATERNDAGVIDPMLMSSISPPPGVYGASTYDDLLAQQDQRYSQSYERYQLATTPTQGGQQPPTATSRIRKTAKWKPGQQFSSQSHTGKPNDTSFVRPPTSNGDSLKTRTFDRDTDYDKSLPDNHYKRAKYASPTPDDNDIDSTQMPPPQVLFNPQYDPFAYDTHRFAPGVATGSATKSPSPLPTRLENGQRVLTASSPSTFTQASSDPRRLSVESLLSGPPGINGTPSSTLGSTRTIETLSDSSRGDSQDRTTSWGVDRGFRDLDIGKNDDSNAISGYSPVATFDDLESPSDDDEYGSGVRAKDTAFEKGGYYARPVSIDIPKSFEPLPPALLENPMNLLYFHHFISHTARILVPHHCSANPFQNVLPRMALQDENLMNLLLAYSASHRARLLQHPEPVMRIALWVQDVFPNLRHALDDPTKIVSNANLATAIMLASLEIISPKAFGVAISWQQHLDVARRMIVARGGTTTMHRDGSASTNFLLRWFGYLDVVGSLTGRDAGLESVNDSGPFDYITDEENEYNIACLLGFTDRCVSILAKVARLAKSCDRERLAQDSDQDWVPSDEIKDEAIILINDIEVSRTSTRITHCPHLRSTGEATYQWDSREMAATNEAYHFAGLVLLHRRILGKSSQHPDVQNAVKEIIGALYKVRKGSAAEACLVFPMFTAGCEIQDEKQRTIIMERLKVVEGFGLSQVCKARTLLQKVWDTGKPWETLTSGEFLG